VVRELHNAGCGFALSGLSTGGQQPTPYEIESGAFLDFRVKFPLRSAKKIKEGLLPIPTSGSR
jgi:hypothetical protein